MPWRRRTVLVADPEPGRARLLRQHLESSGFRVSLATDGEIAVNLFRTETAVASIVDIQVPPLEDFELLRRLRRESDVPIIVWSQRASEPDVLMAFAIGADAYLPKTASPREVVLRLRALLRRATTVLPERRPLLVHGNIAMNRDRRQVTVDGRPVSLTPTEYRLLEALLERPGRVWTREMLFARLHDDTGSSPDSRSIDFHIARLRKKLEQDPRHPERLRTVRGFGFVMESSQAAAAGHLASQLEWLGPLFSPASYATVVVDGRGVAQMMNPIAERLAGRSTGEAVGKATCHDLFGCRPDGGPGSCRGSRCLFREALTAAAPFALHRVRLTVPRAGGRVATVMHLLLPAPADGPAQVLVVFSLHAQRSASVGRRARRAATRPAKPPRP